MGGTSDPQATDEANLVPLCRVCHTVLHAVGPTKFQRDRPGLDLAEVALSTFRRWTRLSEGERRFWCDWAHGEGLEG